tara:strand:+ start:2466 stop:2996 length:531 start_codon:yes stop_codon:yes gene_type:complete
MTNEKNTTPLSALPKNTDNDTDLVNKILNQLDTSNDSTPPTFELEPPPAEKPSPKPASGGPPRKVAAPPDVRPAQKIQIVEQSASRTPQSMPSPQGIQNVLNSMDMDYIYKIAKMSILYSIIFIGFIFCTNTFVDMFSRIPYISFTNNNELNNSGKVLQSICFGAIYFSINILFPN